jgi:glycosyltransferase involved in cell wall biosynthesis
MVTGDIEPCISKIDEMESKSFNALNAFGEMHLASLLFEDARSERFDLIHIFQGSSHVLPFVPLVGTPVLVTIHDPFSSFTFGLYRAFGRNHNLTFAALSESHARNFPEDVPAASVVGNGIRVSDYPFSSVKGAYMMTCGRIVPDKGHEDAIAAVGDTEELVIAGKFYEKDPQIYNYWLTKILPKIDGKRIKYMSFSREASYKKVLLGAKALLFPIHWEEPFGLVMIDAMATGTPVIAYNRGSVPEVVKDGVTGFIIDQDNMERPGLGTWIIKKQGIEGLVEAIKRIGEIDRALCRKHVEEHFTVEKMAEGYERAYGKILANKS